MWVREEITEVTEVRVRGEKRRERVKGVEVRRWERR